MTSVNSQQAPSPTIMEAFRQEVHGSLQQLIIDANSATHAATVELLEQLKESFKATTVQQLEHFKGSFKAEVGLMIEGKLDQQKTAVGFEDEQLEAPEKVNSIKQFKQMEMKLSSREQDALMYKRKLVSFEVFNLNLQSNLHKLFFSHQAKLILPHLHDKMGYNIKEHSVLASLLEVFFGEEFLKTLNWSGKNGKLLAQYVIFLIFFDSTILFSSGLIGLIANPGHVAFFEGILRNVCPHYFKTTPQINSAFSLVLKRIRERAKRQTKTKKENVKVPYKS